MLPVNPPLGKYFSEAVGTDNRTNAVFLISFLRLGKPRHTSLETRDGVGQKVGY